MGDPDDRAAGQDIGEHGGSGVTAIGWYDDELVRSDGGWRIARRRFTPIHVGTLS